MAPPSTQHHALHPIPGPGEPQSHVDEVGSNQALLANATHVLPAKTHTWALAERVTPRLEPMQVASQKMMRMRATLAGAMVVMQDQEMKV